MIHSAILSIFIKLPFVIKIFVLSIFEWPFCTGFTVLHYFAYNKMFYLSYRAVIQKDMTKPIDTPAKKLNAKKTTGTVK